MMVFLHRKRFNPDSRYRRLLARYSLKSLNYLPHTRVFWPTNFHYHTFHRWVSYSQFNKPRNIVDGNKVDRIVALPEDRRLACLEQWFSDYCRPRFHIGSWP